MKNKVIKITKKLNPKDSLDYDYVGDIYDKIDGAVELKNIKIVSKQLVLKSSTLKVAGKGKKSKKRTKKRTKKSKRKSKKYKRSSRKTRRSYIKKTRKRKMRGGTDENVAEEDVAEEDATYSFNNLKRDITGEEIWYSFELIDSEGTSLRTVEVEYDYIREMCNELNWRGYNLNCGDSTGSVQGFLNQVLSTNKLREKFFDAIGLSAKAKAEAEAEAVRKPGRTRRLFSSSKPVGEAEAVRKRRWTRRLFSSSKPVGGAL